MSTFQDLADTLAELEGIPSRITSEVADSINEDLRAQFDAGLDPYGAAWAPLLPSTVRRKAGDRRILRQTDTLRDETIARPTSGAGIEITSVEYGGYHQGPTADRVARPILPQEGELPKAWQEAIGDASSKAFAKAMRR